MVFVREAYESVIQEIERAASRVGRNPDEVKIVAVSKDVPHEIIQSAIDVGISIFGENRVQEAAAKIPKLKGTFSFHMVGHLQSNKAKDAVRLFDVIHSIDKISTAQKVDAEAAKLGKRQKVLIQVNTTQEATKSGVAPQDALGLCEAVVQCAHLELCGLMTIGPLTSDEGAIRTSFRMLRELRDEISSALRMPLKELSMGMSSDFTIAVEEGATILRIGTRIFKAGAGGR
ncbi:MAG: YggS family pyridoxal phosphate-dependent enzyme [Spirochaetes bacterium]|nr:YggS family pyridoxal phosphate-dependent enzyme [Spirochaetota bacterium]